MNLSPLLPQGHLTGPCDSNPNITTESRVPTATRPTMARAATTSRRLNLVPVAFDNSEYHVRFSHRLGILTKYHLDLPVPQRPISASHLSTLEFSERAKSQCAGEGTICSAASSVVPRGTNSNRNSNPSRPRTPDAPEDEGVRKRDAIKVSLTFHR